MQFFITETDSLAAVLAKAVSQANLSDSIHIILSDGEHKGLHHERIFYNARQPLTIESASGNPKTCAFRAENCEAFHTDTENRALITFGPECTSVTLKNFTIENTHIKTAEDASLKNQAETICFHNQTGRLFCTNMQFISRQDTIHVKGFSHFKNCTVMGDVDFIWGYCNTSVFENCRLHTIKDNRGTGRPAFVLQSRALNAKPGFVFIGCEFTAEDRGENAELFIGRSQGTGKKDSPDRWDSIALVNCIVSSLYSPALWTDENGTKAVFPEKGSALSGWREFNTQIRNRDGSLSEYNSANQEQHGYTMSSCDVQELMNVLSGTFRLSDWKN